jgi:hypothetical protein
VRSTDSSRKNPKTQSSYIAPTAASLFGLGAGHLHAIMVGLNGSTTASRNKRKRSGQRRRTERLIEVDLIHASHIQSFYLSKASPQIENTIADDYRSVTLCPILIDKGDRDRPSGVRDVFN